MCEDIMPEDPARRWGAREIPCSSDGFYEGKKLDDVGGYHKL